MNHLYKSLLVLNKFRGTNSFKSSLLISTRSYITSSSSCVISFKQNNISSTNNILNIYNSNKCRLVNNRYYSTSGTEGNIIKDFFNTKEDDSKKNQSIFIQTETTPNSDNLKFLPGIQVLPDGKYMDFPDFKSTQISPLANQLFKLDGVNRVFLSSNYISVNKEPDVEWSILKPQIFGTIIDFFHSGKEVLTDQPEVENSDTLILPEDDETVAMIKELIETRVRPNILEDGGNIQYVGFKDGIVMVKLQGSCSSCSSSQATLKGGIERMLMYWISDVRGVIAVTDNDLENINMDYFNSVDEKINNDSNNENNNNNTKSE
ncbi:NIF system FeS cluster assembly domain-containing protein [Tieghemostelium lacteum]|uniref:NIF system FeS cluster assembly domain-containing protein n=1 Tax=Tieghemostelium lacteum TaxID=361077 RepID=A0A151ZC67_TIELA|nr:NIF system FeS cluster assembly domain-containing protein [Tieghemostelium lacteum]|eukprot:KYQ91529.1 NIF system FeS cluster assembly domain-containing protein [Tieghemostelium lacteum]